LGNHNDFWKIQHVLHRLIAIFFALARAFVEGEEAFLVLYSDDVVFGTPGDAKVMVDLYAQNPAVEGIIMAQEVSPDVVDKYGIISFQPGTTNHLANIVEKPNKGEAPSQLASYGRYLLKPTIFAHLSPSNTGKDSELWTVDAITKAAQTATVLVEHTKGQWMTTGDPENYFQAHLKFVMEHEKYGAKIKEWVNAPTPVPSSTQVASFAAPSPVVAPISPVHVASSVTPTTVVQAIPTSQPPLPPQTAAPIVQPATPQPAAGPGAPSQL
jgi:NDP-sugar pyrophosphorylase family protein